MISIADAVLISIVLIAAYIIYIKSTPKKDQVSKNYFVDTQLAVDERKKLPVMTHEELRKFDGKEGRPIYIGILNDIFDCSTGDKFYGPGGSYEVFAGRDISLAAAKFSTEEKYLDNYNIDTITLAEKDSLRHYFNVLSGKYPAVGRLDKKKKQ